MVWLEAIEIYKNPIQAELLMAQNFQEWKFGPPHQAKYHEVGEVLAEDKGKMDLGVEEGSHHRVTSCRNEDCNC